MSKKLHAVPDPTTKIDPAQEAQRAAALAAFAKRHGLSTRGLSFACGGPGGGISKTFADRIMRGVTRVRLTPERRHTIINHLRKFLSSRGLTADAITAEITSIFPEEVKDLIFRTALPYAVQEHFGLRRDPFDPSRSDPRDASEVFTYPALDRVAETIEDAINYQGFLAVVGEVGSGKTQLKKRVVEKVWSSGGRHRLMFPDFSEMRRVNSGAVVSYVLESFDQKPRRNLVAAFDQLRQHLGNLSEQGIRVALAFDEAHRLNDDELTALKNFWELGSGGYQRYLGVILFGQPRFLSRLEEAKFREIAERVQIVHMPGLGKHAYAYLAHRIQLAGGDIERLFERKAVELLAAQAETPLALGNLANGALVKAHSLGEKKVLAAFVDRNRNADDPRARTIRRAS